MGTRTRWQLPPLAARRLCATCHAGEVKEFASSIHGRARGQGDTNAPSCADCHGATHKVVEASAADSPVNSKNLPSTCGHCHSDPKLAQKYLFAGTRPVEAYEASVHARAIREGKKAAACNDCHGTHAILPPSDPRSPISKRNVGSTCGKCHAQAFTQYQDSIHGRAVAAGVTAAPTCTDCHGEHNILAPGNPQSPVYVTNVATATCSRCHGDTRLEARFNLPSDRVTSYENSYHGLAARGRFPDGGQLRKLPRGSRHSSFQRSAFLDCQSQSCRHLRQMPSRCREDVCPGARACGSQHCGCESLAPLRPVVLLVHHSCHSRFHDFP